MTPMKTLYKLSLLLFLIATTATACHNSAGTQSTADTSAASTAPRDVTQSDTEKVDTTKPGSTHVQGDGHPRGGME